MQPWCGGNLAAVPHVGHLRALPLQRAVGPLPARVPRLRVERARVGGRGRIDEVANGGPRPVAKDGPRSVSACASVCGAAAWRLADPSSARLSKDVSSVDVDQTKPVCRHSGGRILRRRRRASCESTFRSPAQRWTA